MHVIKNEKKKKILSSGRRHFFGTLSKKGIHGTDRLNSCPFVFRMNRIAFRSFYRPLMIALENERNHQFTQNTKNFVLLETDF